MRAKQRSVRFALATLLIWSASAVAQEDSLAERLRELSRLEGARRASPSDVASVARALADEDWRVRHKAAQVLASMGSEGVPSLVEGLASPLGRVRDAANRGLAAAAPSALAEHLGLILGRVQEPRNTLQAFLLSPVLDRLGREHAPARAAIAKVYPLSVLRPGQAGLAELRRLASARPDLRGRCLEELSTRGPLPARDLQLFVASLSDERPQIRERAAQGLARLGATELLAGAAKAHPEAARALASSPGGLIEIRARYLEAPRELRATYLSGLSELIEVDGLSRERLNAAALPVLRLALRDRESGLRLVAAKLVPKCGLEGLRVYLAALRSSDPEVASCVARQARGLHEAWEAGPRTLRIAPVVEGELAGLRSGLRALLAHPEPRVRVAGLRGLAAAWPHASSVAALSSTARHDRSPVARAQACQTLSVHPGWTRLEVLREVALDSAPEVAEAAAEALAAAGDVEGIDRLLRSEDPGARRAASLTLHNLGRLLPIPLATLLEVLGDERPEVRAAVLQRLRVATLSPEVVKALAPRFLDSEPAVRAAARRALQSHVPAELFSRLSRAPAFQAHEILESARLLAKRRDPSLRRVLLTMTQEEDALARALLAALPPGEDLLPAYEKHLSLPASRTAALEGIAALGSRARPLRRPVRELLPDPGAIAALGRIGTREDALPLAALLLDPDRCELALAALCDLGPAARDFYPQAFEVHALLAADPEWSPRWGDLRRLIGDAPSPGDAARFVSAVRVVLDRRRLISETPWGALGGLGSRGAPALPFLFDCACDPDLDFDSRRFAISALLEIAPDFDLAAGLRESFLAVPSLDNARLLTVHGRQFSVLAIPLLERAVLSSKDHEHYTGDVFETSFELAGVGPAALPALSRLARNPSPRVRAQVVGGLAGGSPSEEILALLRTGLADPEARVRSEAASTLRLFAARGGSLEPARLAPALAELLEAESWWDYEAALKAIAELSELSEDLERALVVACARPELRSDALRILASKARRQHPDLRRIFAARERGALLAACALLRVAPENGPATRRHLEAALGTLGWEDLRLVAQTLSLTKGGLTVVSRHLRQRAEVLSPWDTLTELIPVLTSLEAEADLRAIATDALRAPQVRAAARQALAELESGD